jgi:3-deoxy-manno-octulosonate cytidylyltransferase (CMP-KDO synthetase)
MQRNEGAFRVVIPARYASSRLPGKPLVDLAGKPMVVRVYEAVISALPAFDIVVATDDSRIHTVLNRQAIPSIMTRIDHESGSDRAAEVARVRGWGARDIVINIQGDEPLIPPDLLQAFAAFCKARRNMSMATLAVPLEAVAQISNPNIVKLTIDANSRAIAFSRAALPFNRDLPPAEWVINDYLRHVGIYAYRNSVLQLLTTSPPCALEKIEKLEQLRAQWLGVPIDVMRWQSAPPHGVDTLADVERVVRFFREVSQ